jgi:hypothetical protein
MEDVLALDELCWWRGSCVAVVTSVAVVGSRSVSSDEAGDVGVIDCRGEVKAVDF